MAYIGKSPSAGVRQRYYFTATGGETSISGADDNGKTLIFSDGEYIDVYLNGVLLVAGTDYVTTTTNTISSLAALSASDIVEVVVYDVFSVADTVSASAGGTFSGNVNFNANISIDGGTIKLDGNYPTGTGNVALGNETFDAVTTGQANTAIGDNALSANTSGNYNTAVGRFSLIFNTTGEYNTGVGYDALFNTTSDYNTALGADALYTNTTGSQNTAVGLQALQSNTTASYNTAVGMNSAQNNTTGQKNTALGHTAGRLTTTGSYNVSVGQEALYSNTTASYNTAVGYKTLYSNTTGASNTAMGAYDVGGGYGAALQTNTTGSNNAAYGVGALQANSTGNYNTALGTHSLLANTTASNNTAVGYQAGYSNTTGSHNTFIGDRAGYSFNTSGNTYNTCIGYAAGYSLTTGIENFFAGQNTGFYVTTGSKNTIIGGYSGNQGGLDIRTSSNYIVLSDGDGNPRLWMKDGGYIRATGNSTPINTDNTHMFGNAEGGSDYAVAIFSKNDGTSSGYPLFVSFNDFAPDDNTSRFITCSDSSTNRLTIYSDGDVVNHDNSYGAISDVKLKEQITDASSQWDDIKALTVRKYKMKSDVTEKGDSDDLWRLGVVAQEVETAGMSGLVTESPDKDADNNDLGTTTKQVKYSILYMKAVKALQEAMDRIETLEAKVAALESN